MVQNLWTTGFFHPSPLPYRLVKIFLIYSHWCFWPFPLSIQFHTLLFVLIAVFHKNTPNTGCPVLGVHINAAGEYFYNSSAAGVAMLKEALKDYSTSVSVQFYAAKMPESAGSAITQASYVLHCSRGGVRVYTNYSSDWTSVKVAVHRVQDGGDTYCYMIVIYEK